MLSPPSAVLAAFGAAGSRPVPLGGGQGRSWLAGDVVIKPAEADLEELTWQDLIFSQMSSAGLRLARPRRAADGSLLVDGWCATEHVTGTHQPGRWPEIIVVGERFHAALRGIPRPSFLDQRASRWAISDRVAWGEIPASEFPYVRHLPGLVSALRPVTAASQLIHGDLTGNVLFDRLQPPAIIDFSPYWRPTAYASAIVVADALVWEGADRKVLDAVTHIDEFGQYLVRALIFRAVTDWIFRQEESANSAAEGDDPWARAVNIACQLAAAGRLCDGLAADGGGCWLSWTGPAAVSATVPPPFRLRTAERREGPGRWCSPSTLMANSSPSARVNTAAPTTTG